MPDTPVATDPEDWPHYPLWKRVRQAVLAAPDHFETNIHLEGIHATDLHTLNDPLAASIEEIFVATLNRLHHAWDPDLRYERHAFVHQPRTFPNVILRQQQHGAQPLMGIEVKTWHLLAREQAPSCRFTATEAACNPWDLLAVVPWSLAYVLSGSPKLLRPFVQPAIHCARKRNHHWQHERTTTTDTGIRIPTGITPYPSRTDRIADIPRVDSGHNFGCLARHGIMDEYIHTMLQEPVSGIPAERWLQFLQSKGQQ